MNTSRSPNGTSHKLIDLTKSILPASINTKFLNGSSPNNNANNNNNIKNNLRNNNSSSHASQLNFITNTINNFMVNHGLLSPTNTTQEKIQNGNTNSNIIKRLSSSPLSTNGIVTVTNSSPTRRSNRSSDVSSACESITTTGRGSNSSRYSTSLSSSVSCDSSDAGTLSSNNSNTYITNSFSSSSMSSSSSCSSSEDMAPNNHKKRSLSNSFMNTSSENSSSSSFTSSGNSSRITRNSQKTTTSCSSSSTAATTMSVDDQNVIRCLWTKCNFTSQDIDEKLIEHIKTKHILTQRSFHQFRCFWKDCSVYGNPSCSFNWLERHVIDHVDQKPFMCIFNGCKRRFRTEALRERHVQSHINEPNNNNLSTNGFSNHAQSNSLSPTKNRNNLLKTAKLALIENLKNKNSTSSLSLNDNNCSKNVQYMPTKSASLSLINGKSNNNSSANLLSSSTSITTNGNSSSNANTTSSILPNYSQILKTLTKKRKNLSNNDTTGRNKFKKAQYKDYLDPTSFKIIDKKLKHLNYESGKVTFNAKIISSRVDSSTNLQSFLVEWQPRNMYVFFILFTFMIYFN